MNTSHNVLLRGDAVLEANREVYKYLSVVVAAAIIATVLIFGLSSAGQDAELRASVSATFGHGVIKVHVSLPGPQYYYYYYYQYSHYTAPSIPVMTIIVVEKMVVVDGRIVPEMVDGGGGLLYAFSYSNELSLVFHLEPGHYRVKVYFWNGLLASLAAEGKAWKPLIKPYVEEGDVS